MHSDFPLNRNYQEKYGEILDEQLLPEVKNLTNKNSVLKLLYKKFPTKMAEIDDSLSVDEKLVEFLARDVYDKLVKQQIRELKNQGIDDWQQEEEYKAPQIDYEEIAKEEMKGLITKSSLYDYASIHNINIDANTSLDNMYKMKQKILKERIKQLKGEIDVPGNKTTNQKEFSEKPKTRAEYEPKILDDVSGMKKSELRKYANDNDLNLNLTSRATLPNIRDAVVKKLTNKLMNEPEPPEKTTKDWMYYVNQIQEDIRGMNKPALIGYAEHLHITVPEGLNTEAIRRTIINQRADQLMKKTTEPPEEKAKNDWIHYQNIQKEITEDIKGMDIPALLGYAERLNITVPEGLKIVAIRRTIINQRADQLMQKTTGSGLKKRIIFGKGYSSDDDDKPVRRNTIAKKIINGKFIDLNKLKNNILTIRYVKTGGFVPTVKSQHISNDVKSVIDDIINDKFEKRLFDKLETNDKRLIKRLITALKVDIDISSKEEDEYRRQFDILLGELRAGNNSDLVKNKLKQYVVESMNSGMLTRREAFQLLYELTINN
jgi:hypothetical protein